MMGWLIIAVGAIAMFAFLAANAASGISAAGEAQGRIETIRRLDAARSAIEKDAREAGPEMLLPVGEQGPSGQGYRVPPRLGLTALSPFGNHFVYCPFGPVPSGGTPLTITSPNSSIYGVGVASGRVVSGRPNLARVSADRDLLGFIIAPAGRSEPAASCNQVTFDATTGQFIAPNSIVRPLRRYRGEIEQRAAAARELVLYVSPTGSADSLGVDQSNPTTVVRAMSELVARRPETATVNFLPGSYTLAPNVFVLSGDTAATRGFTGRVTFQGVGSSTPVIAFPSLATMVPYSDVMIRNLNFGNGLLLRVDRLRQAQIVSSTIAGVHVSGGTVQLQNAALAGVTGDATLLLDGGSVSATGSNQVSGVGSGPVVWLRRGGDLNIIGGTFSVVPAQLSTPASSSLISVSAGSKFTAEGAAIVFTKPATLGFEVSGSLRLLKSTVSSSVSLSNAIRMYNLGSAELSSTTLMMTGTRPSGSTVRDFGGTMLVSGEASDVGAGAQCWEGQVFAFSGTGVGVSSGPAADEPVPAIDPVPTSALVERHLGAVQRNAQRAVARAANQSSWTCR